MVRRPKKLFVPVLAILFSLSRPQGAIGFQTSETYPVATTGTDLALR